MHDCVSLVPRLPPPTGNIGARGGEVGHAHVSAFCILSAYYLSLLKYTIVYYSQMDNVLLLNSGGSVVQLGTMNSGSRPQASPTRI